MALAAAVVVLDAPTAHDRMKLGRLAAQVVVIAAWIVKRHGEAKNASLPHLGHGAAHALRGQ